MSVLGHALPDSIDRTQTHLAGLEYHSRNHMRFMVWDKPLNIMPNFLVHIMGTKIKQNL